MTEESVRLREALTVELDAMEVREPGLAAVVAGGRRTRRRRRVTVGALVGGVLLIGPAVQLAGLTDTDRDSVARVSVGTAPPGSPGDLVGEGTIAGHPWTIRVTRPTNDRECVGGEFDGRPVGPHCGSVPQVLVGDAKAGIGHLNYSGGPFADEYGSVVGVVSDEVSVVVLRLDDGTEFRATPTDVGAAHRYFAFAFEGSPDFTLTAYDAQGRQLARGARK